MYNSYDVQSLQYDRAVRVTLGQLIMTSLAKQFTAPQIISIIKIEKFGTDVYVTNSLNHWPPTPLCYESVHRNHAGTIGHCDVTIATGWLIFRWSHNRSTAVCILKSSGEVAGWNMDLRQLSHRNHINDWCKGYREPEILGRCYQISASHPGLSGDSGWFSQL